MANKAVFLDRDDTLIEDPGYINHPDQVKLLAGTPEALIELHKMGYLLVVVSNQSGVARGIVTEEGLAKIHERMDKLLSYEGANLDAIYYCPFHPNGVIEEYRKESDLRKPSPGMLLQAAEEMDIDLEESWMVGNAYRDISAGIRAGCKTILVASAAKPAHKKPSDPMPFKKAVNIREAVNIIKMYNQQKQQVSKDVKGDKSTKSKKPRRPVKNTVQSKEVDKKEVKPPAAVPEPAKLPEDRTRQMMTQQSPAETKTSVQEPAVQPPADEHMHAAHTHHLLEEMLRHLKNANRENMFHDFSALKMLAGAIQVMVLFCLVISIWKLMDQTASPSSVHTAIGYAIVLQLMVIAFCLMRDRK